MPRTQRTEKVEVERSTDDLRPPRRDDVAGGRSYERDYVRPYDTTVDDLARIAAGPADWSNLLFATRASADAMVMTLSMAGLGTVLQSYMNFVNVNGDRMNQTVAQASHVHATHLATTASAANRVLYGPDPVARAYVDRATDNVRIQETLTQPLAVT